MLQCRCRPQFDVLEPVETHEPHEDLLWLCDLLFQNFFFDFQLRESWVRPCQENSSDLGRLSLNLVVHRQELF